MGPGAQGDLPDAAGVIIGRRARRPCPARLPGHIQLPAGRDPEQILVLDRLTPFVEHRGGLGRGAIEEDPGRECSLGAGAQRVGIQSLDITVAAVEGQGIAEFTGSGPGRAMNRAGIAAAGSIRRHAASALVEFLVPERVDRNCKRLNSSHGYLSSAVFLFIIENPYNNATPMTT